jgi:Na+/melibiose symporter-like transporter
MLTAGCKYGYYLPFFFQSAQGTSTTESGVRFIAMVAPQIITLVVTGALVTTWGYYVRYQPLHQVGFVG